MEEKNKNKNKNKNENMTSELGDRIFSEIMRVFGLPRTDSEALFQAVSERGTQDPNFFTEILKKLTPPTLVEFPRRPRLNAESPKFEEVYKRFEGRRKAFQETKPTNTTLFVNEGTTMLNNNGRPIGSVPKGEFGFVKKNRKQPFAYKFSKIYTRVSDLKLLLLEPVINCILQSDPIAAPIICRIDRVFCYYDDDDKSFQLIYRLERLESTLFDGFTQKITDSVSEKPTNNDVNNYNRITCIFAPLFQILFYLGVKYSFRHNDLHQNNILFLKNPDVNDGTPQNPILPEHYRVKIIDFGLSELNVLGKRFNGRFSNQLGGTTEYMSFRGILGKGAWYQLPYFRKLSDTQIREEIVEHYEQFLDYNNNNKGNYQNSKDGGARRTRRIRPRLTRKRKY